MKERKKFYTIQVAIGGRKFSPIYECVSCSSENLGNTFHIHFMNSFVIE